MAYVYSGNSRSFRVTVTKYVNGVPQTPTTYPTATDIANGYFTYSGGQVPIPSPETLAQMTSSEYAAILIALQTYAQEQNPGLNFSTAVVTVPAVIENDPNCPVPGTPAEPAATTTTTPEPEVTTTTTELMHSVSVFMSYSGDLGANNGLGGSVTIDEVEYQVDYLALGFARTVYVPDGGSCEIDVCSVMYYKEGNSLQPVFGYTVNSGSPQGGCIINLTNITANQYVNITVSET